MTPLWLTFIFKHKSIIAIALLVIFVFGGWYLYFREKGENEELSDKIGMLEAAPETVFVQGTVISETKHDTTFRYIYKTKFDTLVTGDTVYSAIPDKDSIMVITKSESGTIEIDTTLTDKLIFHAAVQYPSGESLLSFKWFPQKKTKRSWFAGIGIGITDQNKSIILADVNYRRFGIGAIASDTEVGGYLRINF